MECLRRIQNSIDENIRVLNATHFTEEDIDEYRSCLSEVSFRNRLPLTVYLSVVAVVGFIGNALIMIVYWQSFKPSASRIFVLAMAIEDMTINVIALPLQIITIRYAYNTYSKWLCRGLFAAATFPTQTAGLILVTVALDRFSRIWWPTKKHINEHQCCVINIVIFIFAHVLFAGFIPVYGIHSYPSHIEGVSVKMCWYDDEYSGTPYSKVFTYVVYVIVFGGLVLMTTSYILIGIKVWKRKTPMKKSMPLTAKSFQICSPEYPVHSKHAGEATVIDEPQENSESMSTRGGADDQTASGSAQNITVVEVSTVHYSFKCAMSTTKTAWRKKKVSYEEEHHPEITPNLRSKGPSPPSNDPNQPLKHPNLPFNDLNQPLIDPNPPSNDPNQPSYHPNQPFIDPDLPSNDPNQPSYHPNQPLIDPDLPSNDPNQPSYHPNQPFIDPNPPSNDPNQPFIDPDLPSNDPNQPLKDPNLPLKDEKPPSTSFSPPFKDPNPQQKDLNPNSNDPSLPSGDPSPSPLTENLDTTVRSHPVDIVGNDTAQESPHARGNSGDEQKILLNKEDGGTSLRISPLKTKRQSLILTVVSHENTKEESVMELDSVSFIELSSLAESDDRLFQNYPREIVNNVLSSQLPFASSQRNPCPQPVKKTETVSSHTRKIQSRTTITMSVLTFFYVVNWIPHCYMRFSGKYPPNCCPSYTDCGANISAFCLRSIYLNSAVNAFVYSYCSTHFRIELSRMSRRLCRRFSRTL